MNFDARHLASLQAALTAAWHEQAPGATGEGFERLACENHLRNFLLWHEEDIARRDDLGCERVCQAKRAIDRFNQERNNFIEEMDRALAAALEPPAEGCTLHSETPGMIIDRLSILSLKEFHMREQSLRADADPAHRAACAAKLSVILRQREDLTRSLAELIQAVETGARTFAVYYQFKMYNDPSLNPQLYQGSGAPGA